MSTALALATLWTTARSNPQEEDNYPIGGLKCYYTLKRGTNAGIAGSEELDAILCPEGQNKYCVKQEIDDLDRIQCGQTEYFGDKYYPDPIKQCLFRKCASECSEGTDSQVYTELIEEFRESPYTRRTFCCQTDYCNAAPAIRPSLLVVAVLLLANLYVR